MINYVVGDATEPIGESDVKIIAHVCNDQYRWGRGFVLSVSKKWPIARTHYLREKPKIGHVQYVFSFQKDFTKTMIIANMVAQRGIRSKQNTIPLDYEMLDNCLNSLGCRARFYRAPVHMPRIGCGLAGGDWGRVEKLIERNLKYLSVYVYDLPKETR